MRDRDDGNECRAQAGNDGKKKRETATRVSG